jgi:hypothetical protein
VSEISENAFGKVGSRGVHGFSLYKVEPERDLLDTFLDRVDAFFAV